MAKKKKLIEKPIAEPITTYSSKVGCWNCDDVYNIDVIAGISITQYLIDSELECRKCLCISLRNINEYKVNKKIMKDVMLHRTIENYESSQIPKPQHNDHYQ